MTENRENERVEKVETDIVIDFKGGTVKCRVPNDFEINGKTIHVDYAFVVMCDGKKHNLPLPALEAIVIVLQDPRVQTFLAKLPERESI